MTETKPLWLSPSSINLYRYCPHKFYLKYIRKLKQKENIHLIRGTVVHKVLTDFITSEVSRDPEADLAKTREQLLFSLKSEWHINKEKLLKLQLHPQDMAFYYDQSQKMLINWLHAYLKHKIYEYPMPETEVMFFSNPDKLCGRIDAIYKPNGKPILFEFKTNKSDAIDDNLKMQLGIYAWLYESKFNIRPRIAIHFVNFKDGLKFFRISDQFLANTKKEIRALQNTLSSQRSPRDFPCTCRANKACERDFYG